MPEVILTTEEMAEVLNTRSFLKACEKYRTGTVDASRFIQVCFDCGIMPLPGTYLIKQPVTITNGFPDVIAYEGTIRLVTESKNADTEDD